MPQECTICEDLGDDKYWFQHKGKVLRGLHVLSISIAVATKDVVCKSRVHQFMTPIPNPQSFWAATTHFLVGHHDEIFAGQFGDDWNGPEDRVVKAAAHEIWKTGLVPVSVPSGDYSIKG